MNLLLESSNPRILEPSILAIASGKGGVGKTSFTLNLATQLAKQGKKVLVLDGDTGLANADVQLNLTPERDLAHYLSGQFALRNILTPTPQGFTLIAGRAGHNQLANLPLPKLHQLMQDLRHLAQNYDVTLIDVAAGVAPTALTMCAEANHTLLITTPDPSSLTDAYALIKLLWHNNATANCQLIVNQANTREAAQVHHRLTTAAEKFLSLPPLPLLGHIPQCKNFSHAVRNHQLASIAFPNSSAVTALTTIAQNITKLS